MRYYLDTNILVFLWTGELDNLSPDTMGILGYYCHTRLTSSVCVIEFMHLLHIGKFNVKKQIRSRHAQNDVVTWMEEMGIEIVHTTDIHLRTYNALPIHTDEHRDPFDRFIIAQAIADRIPLVSSDRKFQLYESDGLQFVYNKR